MVFDDNYFKSREEAIAWLNRRPDRRDYATGVDILGRMGFKPQLHRRLSMASANAVLQRILVQAVTDACNFYRNPANPKYDDVVPAEVENIVDGPHQSVRSEAAAAADNTALDESTPANVRTVCKWFSQAYKQREVLHREMRGIGENNDAQSLERRRSLSNRINALSDYMDTAYPIREAYFHGGTIPTDEQIAELGPPERVTPATTPEQPSQEKTTAASLRIQDEDYNAMSLNELRRRKRSIRTTLVRKRNMLLYQSERKEEKENPMPFSPARTKIETQVRALDDKLYDLEKALAARG